MPSTDFNTWEAAMHFKVHHGGMSESTLRDRTLKLVYIDRALQFDHIEWELDNHDGVLTRPEHLALGLVVSIKMGYLDGGTFPWRSFIINKLRGGVGVYGRENAAVGENESKITYHGRNRNAPGGRASSWNRSTRRSRRKNKPGKIYPPTDDVKNLDMALSTKKASYIEGRRTSDVVRALAARNGFEGSFVEIEETADVIEGLVIRKNEDDKAIVDRLAKKLNFICKVEGNTFHWHSPSWSGTNHEVVEKLIYGSGPDILKLDIDADFKLPVPLKVQTTSYDFNKRSLLVGSVDYSNNVKQANFGIMHINLTDPVRSRALVRDASGVAIGSLGSATQKAQAHFLARNWNAFQINLKVVGNPKLLATRLIELGGTGSPLVDGKWYISEARHIRDGGGYTTEVKLKHPPKKVTGAYGKRRKQLVQNPTYDNKTKELHAGIITWAVSTIKRLRK